MPLGGAAALAAACKPAGARWRGIWPGVARRGALKSHQRAAADQALQLCRRLPASQQRVHAARHIAVQAQFAVAQHLHRIGCEPARLLARVQNCSCSLRGELRQTWTTARALEQHTGIRAGARTSTSVWKVGAPLRSVRVFTPALVSLHTAQRGIVASCCQHTGGSYMHMVIPGPHCHSLWE